MVHSYQDLEDDYVFLVLHGEIPRETAEEALELRDIVDFLRPDEIEIPGERIEKLDSNYLAVNELQKGQAMEAVEEAEGIPTIYSAEEFRQSFSQPEPGGVRQRFKEALTNLPYGL